MKAMLVTAAIVGSGGFIGAMFRFGLGGVVQRSGTLGSFPYGTLVVNMLGCLLIGLSVGLFESRQMIDSNIRSFVLVGLLGGFTTYSTFGIETFALLREADYLRAITNVAVHVVLGVTLVWIGYSLASR